MEKKRDLETLELRAEPKSVQFKIDEETRTVEFPFSSEKPVNRGHLGDEILDHESRSVDLTRLLDAAPLLFNHDRDKPIGVVEDAYLKNKRGYVKVRFSNNPFPSEVFNDVKSGILRGVSVGYSVNKTQEESDTAYRVVGWQPMEVSITPLAADPSVGVGRSKEVKEENKKEVTMSNKQESSNMRAQRINDDVAAAPVASQTQQTLPKEKMTDTPDLSVVRSEERKKAQQEERSRITNISALGAQHGCEDLATTLVESGASIDEARAAVLERIGAKPVETVSQVDMTQEKNIDYKLTTGIRAALTGDWSSKEAGYVRELSQEVERSGIKLSLIHI